jgi:hypothetical protein
MQNRESIMRRVNQTRAGRECSFSAYALSPSKKIVEFPITWIMTKKIIAWPVTAMRIFLPTVLVMNDCMISYLNGFQQRTDIRKYA